MNSIDIANHNLNSQLPEEDQTDVAVMTSLFIPKLTEVLGALRRHNATDEQIAEVLSGVIARSIVKMRNDMPVRIK